MMKRTGTTQMGFFRRKARNHLIPIHPHNFGSKDWLILLEAGTIIGPSPEGLRVARATQERKIVRKRTGLLGRTHFLVVEGYDPRIHPVYFCPQLYKYDSDEKLVPLPGEEMGKSRDLLRVELQRDEFGMNHWRNCRIRLSSALQR
jgi:hypothetical protein